MEQPAPFATSYRVDRKDKRTNNRQMFPALKDSEAAGSSDNQRSSDYATMAPDRRLIEEIK